MNSSGEAASAAIVDLIIEILMSLADTKKPADDTTPDMEWWVYAGARSFDPVVMLFSIHFLWDYVKVLIC